MTRMSSKQRKEKKREGEKKVIKSLKKISPIFANKLVENRKNIIHARVEKRESKQQAKKREGVKALANWAKLNL